MPLGFQDNPGNILGTDSANNQYSSTNVTGNADGSIIERQEYMQTQIAALATGEVVIKGVADAGVSSTTEVAIAGLSGYGDDFFNTRFYMQILHNANNATAAPEAQVRQITDYVSATGTFTMTAFGAAVEEDDICLILHESQVAIGRNDADNVYASNTVAANADGSVLERQEFIQTTIGTPTDTDIATDLVNLQAVADSLKAGGGIGSGIVRKTVTFSNTAEDVDLFDVTGTIIARLVAVCTTNLESAGGCNIGVDAGGIVIIADTASTDIDAGDIWHDNSPDASVELTSTMKEFIIANGTTILIDVEGAKQVDSGVIEFYLIWTALSSDGAVAAAA